ncbi:MAG: M20 family metallopeptidase [Vicinamibacterales bacterium]
MQSVLAYCEAQRDWLLQTIADLVRCESPSSEKAALDHCADHLGLVCAQLNAHVTRVSDERAGDQLIAQWGSAEPQILLLAHYDTVWPVGQLSRMPVRQEDGRLFGPGAFDMKGGIGIALLAVRALLAHGLRRGRIVLLLTSDEETGSHTSRELILREAQRSRAVLVLEPATPEGFVKTSRKGVGVYTLRVSGMSAHAGAEPGRGASAIHELARQITALEALGDPARGVSVNVGRVAGGTRSNVVAEEAWAEVDVRIPSREDAERVEIFMRSLEARNRRTQLVIEGGINRPPFERTAAVADVYEHARSVASSLGFELGEGGTGGASDANLTGAIGVPTLDGLGALGDGAHALHEHVLVDALPRRAALLAGLVLRLAATNAVVAVP